MRWVSMVGDVSGDALKRVEVAVLRMALWWRCLRQRFLCRFLERVADASEEFVIAVLKIMFGWLCFENVYAMVGKGLQHLGKGCSDAVWERVVMIMLKRNGDA